MQSLETSAAADPSLAKSRSLWGDAWEIMRRRPLFWIAAAMMIFFLIMAAFPELFTSKDPKYCPPSFARQPPSRDAIFGYDMLGCDVYVRTVYGARASILVGVLTAMFTALLGSFLGTVAAYFGGWVDQVISRLADVFFAIPLLLGAIIIMYSIPTDVNAPLPIAVMKVVFALSVLGWPNIFRLMRASVLQTLPHEYVLAARALGARSQRIMSSHVIPNSLTPVLVVSTIDLGAYIAVEATLSFLGIGLPGGIISWGRAISAASGIGFVRQAPHMLVFPAVTLSLTVLSFIMLGEVIRDAIDPKMR